LPDYHRLAIGTDNHGWLGEIYADSYDLSRFTAAVKLSAPPAATRFVILDPEVVTKYVADPERLHVSRFSFGGRIYTWSGPTPTLHYGQLWLGGLYRERRGLA